VRNWQELSRTLAAVAAPRKVECRSLLRLEQEQEQEQGQRPAVAEREGASAQSLSMRHIDSAPQNKEKLWSALTPQSGALKRRYQCNCRQRSVRSYQLMTGAVLVQLMKYGNNIWLTFVHLEFLITQP
jgi:hypothetical protein